MYFEKWIRCGKVANFYLHATCSPSTYIKQSLKVVVPKVINWPCVPFVVFYRCLFNGATGDFLFLLYLNWPLGRIGDKTELTTLDLNAATEQAVNTYVRHIQQTRSSFSIYLESCLKPPNELPKEFWDFTRASSLFWLSGLFSFSFTFLSHSLTLWPCQCFYGRCFINLEFLFQQKRCLINLFSWLLMWRSCHAVYSLEWNPPAASDSRSRNTAQKSRMLQHR